MIDYLIDIDTQIFLLIHNCRSAFLDSFMYIFSGRLTWAPMYAAILFFLIRDFGWKKAFVFTIAIVLTITLADQVCATFIRPHCARLRPSNLANPLSAMVTIINNHRGGSYGFPSCHAANTFALAAIVALIARHKALTAFLFIWALITCWSRVYLGVHYPGDLLVGAIIGTLCGILLYYIAAWVISRIMHSSVTTCGSPLRTTVLKRVKIHASDTIIIVGCATIFVIFAISLWKILTT